MENLATEYVLSCAHNGSTAVVAISISFVVALITLRQLLLA